MCRIDRVTTRCSENVDDLSLCEDREEAWEEFEGNIFECEGRSISEVERIEIARNMLHGSDIVMVPLFSICTLDNLIEFIFSYPEVPPSENRFRDILISFSRE